jgi:hypothetical protein
MSVEKSTSAEEDTKIPLDELQNHYHQGYCQRMAANHRSEGPSNTEPPSRIAVPLNECDIPLDVSGMNPCTQSKLKPHPVEAHVLPALPESPWEATQGKGRRMVAGLYLDHRQAVRQQIRPSSPFLTTTPVAT